MGRGHEVGHERATACWTGKRVGPDAEPPAVVGAALVCPELFVGEQLLVEKTGLSGLEAALLHPEKLAVRVRSTSGNLCLGPVVRSAAAVGPGACAFRAHAGPFCNACIPIAHGEG